VNSPYSHAILLKAKSLLKHMSDIIQITGSAMAVLIGVVLIIAPWTSGIVFGYKLLLSVVGAGLCYLGVAFSKG